MFGLLLVPSLLAALLAGRAPDCLSGGPSGQRRPSGAVRAGLEQGRPGTAEIRETSFNARIILASSLFAPSEGDRHD
ncbi:hypothetical protein ACFZB9_05390 [Kitasatospora sp. NPDC008050]|uniref:hypothetical protein n=1 Tax=Kitasatospora sp. NPDC008050 TaxID=3364021 RepID=UPI0036E46098